MVNEERCFEIGAAKQTSLGVHRKTARLKLNVLDILNHSSQSTPKTNTKRPTKPPKPINRTSPLFEAPTN
jgi:hypothetical protein